MVNETLWRGRTPHKSSLHFSEIQFNSEMRVKHALKKNVGVFHFQTVLSGEVYTSMSFLIDMVNVSLELMDPKGKDGCSSLARYECSIAEYLILNAVLM